MDQVDSLPVYPIDQTLHIHRSTYSLRAANYPASAERNKNIAQVSVERRSGQLADSGSLADPKRFELPINEMIDRHQPPGYPLGPAGRARGKVDVTHVIGLAWQIGVLYLAVSGVLLQIY